MTSDHWPYVSVFESFDYVQSWYEREHGNPPNSAKTTQINSFFTQGREFFRNASLADLTVKPLLLYYGVLSLSRGVILLRNRDKKEESLRQSHGLDIVDWRSTLSCGIAGVLDLQIKATKGTFGELAKSCTNRHQEHCFIHQGNGEMVVDHFLGEIRFAVDKSTISLDDLISRLWSTAGDYQRITAKPGKWFPAVVTSHRNKTHFVFLGVRSRETLQALLRSPNANVDFTPLTRPNLSPRGERHFTLVFTHLPENRHVEQFPVFHRKDKAPIMEVILDFPNGDKLSEFFKLYLISYVLGMLARYYPAKWMSLLHGGRGDFAKPLIVKAIEAIETEFPDQLSKQVPGHPITIN